MSYYATPSSAIDCPTPSDNEFFAVTIEPVPSSQTNSVPSDVDEDEAARGTKQPAFAQSALGDIVLRTTEPGLYCGPSFSRKSLRHYAVVVYKNDLINRYASSRRGGGGYQMGYRKLFGTVLLQWVYT